MIKKTVYHTEFKNLLKNIQMRSRFFKKTGKKEALLSF